MEELRNLPLTPAAMCDLIEYRPGSVVSMALSRREDVSMTLFAFDEGDSISSEYYPGDTFYLVLEGRMPLRREDGTVLLSAGACICVPAGTRHAIGGEGRFKLFQITLYPRK